MPLVWLRSPVLFLRMHWFSGTLTGMNGIESSSCESLRAVGHAAIEIQITHASLASPHNSFPP